MTVPGTLAPLRRRPTAASSRLTDGDAGDKAQVAASRTRPPDMAIARLPIAREGENPANLDGIHRMERVHKRGAICWTGQASISAQLQDVASCATVPRGG